MLELSVRGMKSKQIGGLKNSAHACARYGVETMSVTSNKRSILLLTLLVMRAEDRLPTHLLEERPKA